MKQVQGSFNQQAGHGVKGGMQKIEGKVQEKIGDVELEEQRESSQENDDLY